MLSAAPRGVRCAWIPSVVLGGAGPTNATVPSKRSGDLVHAGARVQDVHWLPRPVASRKRTRFLRAELVLAPAPPARPPLPT